MDYASLIAQRRRRFAEVSESIEDPSLFENAKRATETMREHRRLKDTLDLWDELDGIRREVADNQELAKGEDEEIADMASSELPELEARIPVIEEKLQYALLPADPDEDRDALIEIRAGAGGDEASLFAAELMRMYQRHSENRGWKIEHLSSSPSDVGGFKEVVLRVSGDEVFRYLKYESGVHRVQRVPATETQGRVHTSTVTVAVLPEAEEVDIQLRPEDLQIQATRSGGPGGQHVNTTDSAVQITHLPSGIQVKCQDGRSQGHNKERALQILRSRLYEAKQRETQEKYSATRRALIGSGDRSEKIRTYNFPQSRITDHRIGLTTHNIDGILAGDLNEITSALQGTEMAERLAEAESAR